EATYAPGTSANNMASGAVTPDFSRSIQVFDSQGGQRTLTISFLKSATPNVWHAEIYSPDVVDSGGTLVNGQIAVGDVTFNANGTLAVPNPAASPLPLTLNIGASGAGTGVDWATALGIAGQTIALNLGSAGATGGFTQFASASTLISSQVDGAVFG